MISSKPGFISARITEPATAFDEEFNLIAHIAGPIETLAAGIAQSRREHLVKLERSFWRISVPHFLDLHPIAQEFRVNARAATVTGELVLSVEKQFVALTDTGKKLVLMLWRFAQPADDGRFDGIVQSFQQMSLKSGLDIGYPDTVINLPLPKTIWFSTAEFTLSCINIDHSRKNI